MREHAFPSLPCSVPNSQRSSPISHSFLVSRQSNLTVNKPVAASPPHGFDTPFPVSKKASRPKAGPTCQQVTRGPGTAAARPLYNPLRHQRPRLRSLSLSPPTLPPRTSCPSSSTLRKTENPSGSTRDRETAPSISLRSPAIQGALPIFSSVPVFVFCVLAVTERPGGGFRDPMVGPFPLRRVLSRRSTTYQPQPGPFCSFGLFQYWQNA